MTLAQLNGLDSDAFVAVVGPVFEDSPWIAGAAAERRPFGSLDDLLASLVGVVRNAGAERQIALIAAHPDLAGRVAREGRLTAASAEEQASAELDALAASERATFDELNAAYRARFGFPFVICVREHTRSSILAAMQWRIGNSRDEEIDEALREIEAIARLRLRNMVSEE